MVVGCAVWPVGSRWESTYGLAFVATDTGGEPERPANLRGCSCRDVPIGRLLGEGMIGAATRPEVGGVIVADPAARVWTLRFAR